MNDQSIVVPATDRERLAERARELALTFLPGKRVRITFSEAKPPRSAEQNAAIWGVAYKPLMEHMGLQGDRERQELHEYFCGEFWGWKKKNILGRVKLTPKRTTTKDENGKRDVIGKLLCAEFYNFIQRRAAEYGCIVPDPDPEWFLVEQRKRAA